MASESGSLSEKLERLQNSCQKLPAAAAELNNATDLLTKSVGELDAHLKKVGLGIETWVEFHNNSHPEQGYWYSQELGYSKVGGKWGIGIRTVEQTIQDRDVDQWLFGDAPRMLRIRAVEKIPELFEEMLKTAAKTAEEMAEKAVEIDAFTTVVSSIVDTAPKPKVGKR